LNARPLPLFTAGASFLILIGLVAALSSQTTPAPSLTLLAREGRRALPITLLADQEFVALDDLAAAFQLAVHEESLGAITVTYKGKTIVLTPEQALASVTGRLVSLPAPPTRTGRRWLVPVEFISRALTLVYDVRLDLRKPSRLLVVGDLRVPRILVRYDPLGSAGRLTIDATPRANSAITQDGERILIKFDADALDAPAPLLPPPMLQSAAQLVKDVHLVDNVTIAVDAGPRFGGFKAASQPADAAMRLVIDLLGTQTDTAPAAPAPPSPQPPVDVPPALTPPASAIRTIAIDPGHGGEDEGVRGAQGMKEKDLALAIARRVKGVIEARLGVRVLLTRDDDRNTPLDDRTALANNNKADLFISLHANASLRRSVTGATIFSAAFDSSDTEAAMAAPGERVPTFGGGLRDIELVPWSLAQTRHVNQSSEFATILEQQLRNRVPLSAHPIDRAPLRVLESANMPAVLIEVGFLSNAEQEKQLSLDAFQNTFVQAVYDAIVRFRDALNSGGGR
jgi:N-acetylmuramoyl-L-alanine amidase